MAVNVGGKTLKSAYIGDTPIKAIYVGSRQVWSAIRTVTVESGGDRFNRVWNPVSGDFDLIDQAGQYLTMNAPVTSNGDMQLSDGGILSAGTVIPAGRDFRPFSNGPAIYIFTEVI